MSIGSRLVLNVLAWAVSIPALNALLAGLERHRILPLSGLSVSIAGVTLLLWAALIYWRFVPSAHTVARRSVYLAAYLAMMALLGFAALGAAFWITVAIFGL